MSRRERLFLVDAYALIYRSYYAFINRPMRNSEGVNTSPVFGFTRFLHDIIRREKPHYLGVAFDSKGPTFRHELFEAYKANRSETPEDIHAAVPYIKQILGAMRIPILESQGWEADDIIGTLAHQADEAGFEVYMVTPDKDFGQLVRDNVYIYKQLSGGQGVEVIGVEGIKQSYGIDDPRLVIDVLALWGDASDNIPGVLGIGEKGASRLVGEYGSVEQIMENLDKLTPRQRENITAGREQLMLSKQLATINTEVPIEFNAASLVVESPDCEALREIYQQMDFRMFIREMDQGSDPTCAEQLNGQSGEVAPKSMACSANVEGHQGDLFAPRESVAASSGAQNPSLNAQGDKNRSGVAAEEDFGSGEYQTLESVEHTYHHVSTEKELRSLVEILSGCEELAFDCETTGLDPLTDRIVGISLCVKPFESWYVSFDEQSIQSHLKLLKPLLEDDKIAKIGQNIKFDIMVLACSGVKVAGFKYDTMILHYLIDSDARHNMTYLANTYLNYAPIEIESIIGRGAKQITMDMVAADRAAEYGAEDADVTLRLKQVLWPKVVSEDMEQLYRTIEEPMIDVLAQVEMTGIRLDPTILSASGRELEGRLSALEGEIRSLTDEPALNVNSPRQLGDVLFDKMKLDAKPKRTKTKQYRTDEEYLNSLSDRSPVIALILEYRGVKKLLSTYINALPLLINPKTGRIHTSYNQAVASTGRLSSSNPNLQNIPVREEQGRDIRRAFVPSGEDWSLLSADYSQVELRLMAHLSNDENLLDAFDRGEDIHSATAARLFGVPLSEVSSEQRRRAKTANFGIIYGISAFGLGQRLSISRTEAAEIIEGYFRSYPGVKSYMDGVIEQARDVGYVSTIFGRKRWLPDIRSGNAVARGLAERNAINAPIQGSAADIMKIAMIDSVHRLNDSGLRSRVILQVHDELVVDLYKPEQERVVEMVKGAMEGAAKLSVELTVDCSVGENWVDMKRVQ